jgi:AcrR family transcriptional regulator
MRPQVYSDNRIFESISIILAEQGFESLTLRNIAEKAGLSPAILSKRFGSKKGMIIAYYDFLAEVTKKSFLNTSKRSLPPAEALTEIFTQWHEFIKTPRECANYMMLYLKLDIDPELAEISKKRRLIIDAEVQTILEEGIQRGEIACPNVAEMSYALQAAVTGAVMLWCRDETDANPQKLIAACIKMILSSNSGGA